VAADAAAGRRVVPGPLPSFTQGHAGSGLGGRTEEPRWEGAPCPSLLLADLFFFTPFN